jgi:hypothetical protein
VEGIHAPGDATIAAPMPKSGFIALSSHAKHAVACIAASLAGRAPPAATLFNTCCSHVGAGIRHFHCRRLPARPEWLC